MIKVRPQLRDEWFIQPLPESFFGIELSPLQAEQLAVQVAYAGSGFVSPNPLVGAVLLDKSRRLIGIGAHLDIGHAHAEVNAIEDAKKRGFADRLLGALLYCTLEPCAHIGKTPSCARMLGSLSLGTVVIGSLDPNPLVNGKGLKILEEASCKVDRFSAEGQHDCGALAEAFIYNMQTQKPFVGMKVATSLDGAIANVGDQRNFLTSARARQYGHFLRLRYDGIMIGAETLIKDNPTLDVRGPFPRARIPERIVLDPTLRGFAANPSPKILESFPERTTWICSTEARAAAISTLAQKGARILTISPNTYGRFEAEEILNALGGFGLQSLLLEGGALVYRTFLEANLVNKIHCFSATRLLGGPTSVRWGGVGSLAIDKRLSNVEITPIEDEILTEGILI